MYAWEARSEFHTGTSVSLSFFYDEQKQLKRIFIYKACTRLLDKIL